ncbi:MDR family NADP-dependent oxidoreductase [Occallatibacter savannae]|uniref:NADP-dependent oxidoreductase n=1 Tax=Occallatibacter savannae TaxID=1002691 RepID=UPI0019526EBD
MATESREVRLAKRPQGEPGLDCFSFASVTLPDPGQGEVLVRNLCMSVDPYMRGRMNEGKSYVPQFEIGKPLEGTAVGRVIASRDEKLPVGTLVLSMYGWRDAYVAPAAHLRVVDATAAPASAYLGILGVTGLTAWVGLFTIAKLKDGETVFISAGAGAVGSAACQFAKMHGCRVIASAGSEDKLLFLRNELKVDYAFNYRNGDAREHLSKAAPDGIHVYFDNTQGTQLEAALYALLPYGRVAMCGGIAGYNVPVPGPRNLIQAVGKRLRLEGFIVSDHFKEMPALLAEAVPALAAGKLINRETFVDGLDRAPEAFLELLRPGAGNIGKMVVRLAE